METNSTERILNATQHREHSSYHSAIANSRQMDVWRDRGYALSTPGEFSTQSLSAFFPFHFLMIISFNAHLQLAHRELVYSKNDVFKVFATTC